MTPSARVAAAIALLDAIDVAGRRPADAVASAFFRERRFIGGGDRRAIGAIVWDLLRRGRRIGWWLARAGLAGEASARLRVAAHLLLGGANGSDPRGIADGAARPREIAGARLDELRRLFSGGRYGAGSLDPDEVRILAEIDGHTIDHPAMPDAVRHEVPDWLLPSLEDRFGASLGAELAALSDEAPLDLRVNLLRGTRADAEAALRREGIETVATPHSPWGLRAAPRRLVTTGEAFRSGLVEIQDEGSQLIALAVGALPGARVCDLCAGAGGKTLAVAMTMDNRGHLVACDVSAPRLEGAVKRLRRAGVHNAERHLLVPGDKWAKRRGASFDRVLVDAPCTGTGTWRRNPDARLRLRENDLAELVAKQADLLALAARLVRPGGRLVYATCSILPAENEAQVARFRERHPAFRPVAVETLGLPGRGPSLALTPRRHGTDGFFVAVLERDAEASAEAA